MSNIYYKVLDEIKKELGLKWTKKEKILFLLILLCYFGFFISLVVLSNGVINIFSVGCLILSILGVITIILWIRRDFSRIEERNIRDITIRIATRIKELGIDSSEKLSMLICEIEKMNDSDQENRKEIIQIIGTLVKYVIVIPISFFAGFIFKDGETIKAEVLFQIILICIIVFFIFLGFVIMNASSLQYFFTSGKKKREMVLSRLLDIQYLYKYENQERT